ncbi:hypothetical protein P7C71_g3525, partial [Lecanoromycetidae sp. Uapishka_2]
MGLRITTWNGIGFPRHKAMFDILEADIVIFQETKIQRKDLSDDMVLVPGWDCYFSLPRHKKGEGLSPELEELDAANAEASMRKQGLTGLEFVSTPARRLFNQMLEGGKVFGERDEGKENPVMWDICRAFHTGRKGMFTCWEQKVNARPANYSIIIDGEERDVLDVINPPGMFVNGKRQREYSAINDPLPLSGKLIPDFFGRRNIRDMFARKPSLQQSRSMDVPSKEMEDLGTGKPSEKSLENELSVAVSASASTQSTAVPVTSETSPTVTGKKRSVTEAPSSKGSKRSKSGSAAAALTPAVAKGQQSLKGFFKPKSLPFVALQEVGLVKEDDNADVAILESTAESLDNKQSPATFDGAASLPSSTHSTPGVVTTPPRMKGLSSKANSPLSARNTGNVHDPIESKESWSKLFTKPAAPRCEGHDEPCITLLTKKPGMNLGRSFWMCSRPLGPSGGKEKNTQWRCQTFIWCSDWNSNTAHGG